ncbi:MAG: hypothetical protein COB53_13470 [Elusimicrobia bacterium]|nr:MAG: hypothetical protein COB53_13470 [Elusimicrobiota bacterium]
MRALLSIVLCLGLCVPLLAAKSKKKSKPKPKSNVGATADKDTIELVDKFLEAETSRIPPGAIPGFMKIDYKTLPTRQRVPYQAKKAQLKALRMKIDAKTKPPIRRAGQEPLKDCRPEHGSKQLVDSLKSMGFEQLQPDEVRYLEQKTRCNECELTEEFGLKVIIVPPNKKKKQKYSRRYYLMHASSPAMALLAAFRGGSKGGTNFFSMGFFGACR